MGWFTGQQVWVRLNGSEEVGIVLGVRRKSAGISLIVEVCKYGNDPDGVQEFTEDRVRDGEDS